MLEERIRAQNPRVGLGAHEPRAWNLQQRGKGSFLPMSGAAILSSVNKTLASDKMLDPPVPDESGKIPSSRRGGRDGGRAHFSPERRAAQRCEELDFQRRCYEHR